MLRMERIAPDFPELDRVKALLVRAFPANERVPMDVLLDPQEREFWAFYDAERFCGFMNLLGYRDIWHIVYFAIEEELRGNGYGTLALRAVRRSHPTARIIADLEMVREGCANNAQRRSRRHFYEQNGYRPTAIRYAWRGEDYEILSSGGDVSEAEFEDFWRHFERRGNPGG